MIIYKATNKINGKCYIGQTIRTLKQRMAEHKSDSVYNRSKNPIHRSIRKYGFENFEWEIIYECFDIDELNEMEVFYIQEKNSLVHNNGYNICEGGKSGGKRKFTDEHIENMRISQQNRNIYHPHTDESKRKMSESKIGTKHSEESKRKMSESKIGMYCGEKNPMFGKYHSDETKKLISMKLSGKNNPNWGKRLSEEERHEISARMSGENNHFFGIKLSSEHKNKISLSTSVEKIIFTENPIRKIRNGRCASHIS